MVLLHPAGAQADDFFTQRVQPILTRCVACHSGPMPTGGLDLSTRAGALKGGESGPVLTSKSALRSVMFKKAAAKEMPPDEPLTTEQVETLRRWIDAGAAWEGTLAAKRRAPRMEPKRAGLDWWSLQRPRRPVLPPVQSRQWVRNSIDAFVLARLETNKLQPAPAVDRATLLRRVTFDLLGLPPTPAEIDAFVADPSPQAYEQVIDRLLASPHYGERWGRHWLDLARFGESQGYERDKIRDHAWRYRDYVIDSFNADKPYSQFIKEQIAGDVLTPVSPEGIVATGFLVAGPWDEVGQTQQGLLMRLRVREEELEDLVATVGQTFLGMTVNCARCHNHKFDPIPQADYYRLKAALEGVRHGDRSLLTPTEQKARDEQLTQLNRQIGQLESQIAALEQAGRENLQGGRDVTAGLPVPLARWTFETDARDVIGRLHGALHGGAVAVKGRLRLNGKGAYVRTAPLSHPVREKTLEAWVALSNLTQRGGGVMSIESGGGRVFDAIVYGEREPKKWLAGSDFFHRTRDLMAVAEPGQPGELVHMANVYSSDNHITVYRNGAPYGTAYVPTSASANLQTYAANDGRILIGLRHTGAGNGFLAGEIDEARLYDRALSAAEVSASFRAGPEMIPLETVLAALSAEQRRHREALLAELARQRHSLPAIGSPALAYAANSSQPPPTFVLARGDIEKKREQVSPAGLSAVKAISPEFGLPADAPEGARRIKLADWIVHPDNPLTARVLVNRVWHYHFGRGIVASPSDFGFNGDRPTHPELLDWLAREFLAQGGSMKRLHKLILLSNTYCQSAQFNPQAAAMDGDNRLLWRFHPRRLEGEAVRDAMLCISGQMNPQMGGPSFRPFNLKIFNSHFYELTDPIGPEFNRRTVYRINVNSAKSPLLDSLDCPDPSVKMPRRSVTTTPLQALGLMNNSFVVRQSRQLAERVANEAGPRNQVTAAYRLAFCRPPSSVEAKRAEELVRDHGLESLCWALFNASEFMYIN